MLNTDLDLRPITNLRPDLPGTTTPLILAGDSLYLDPYGDEGVDRLGPGNCDLLLPKSLNEKDKDAAKETQGKRPYKFS
jgi:hypothetical protein